MVLVTATEKSAFADHAYTAMWYTQPIGNEEGAPPPSPSASLSLAAQELRSLVDIEITSPAEPCELH